MFIKRCSSGTKLVVTYKTQIMLFAAGPRGWRERENGLEGEWEEGLGRGSTRGMPASARGMRQPWDDKDGHFRKSWDEDNLPEW